MTNKVVSLKELEADLMRWKVAMSILHSIAIACTIFRLWYRRQIRRLWWDDYTSIITLIMESAMFTTLWVTSGRQYFLPRDPKAIASFMLESVSLILILWSTRICLALSIARIYPSGEKHRRLAFGLVTVFSVMGLCIGSGYLTTCATYVIRFGHNRKKPICIISRGLLIVTFIGELSSDVLLVAFPLFALWNVKLPKNQRRLILLVFSAGICTITVIISYIFIVFSPFARNPEGFIALSVMPHFQASISVIVCNSAVVITFIYRTFFNRPVYETSLRSESTTDLTRASTVGAYDTESLNSRSTVWSEAVMTRTVTLPHDPSTFALTNISSTAYSYPGSLRASGDSGNEEVDIASVNLRDS
ncbi:hypothetical protein BDN72DRAFT_942523 [Pluteus cervinus]|uniref:Uncharacterized protein n=1 Tax=Pluteus cervinus TaxID=181527 RepID=A0ACD3AVU2_9AGAR|nr:hypothetical protein BDN72DRAFT_942523 [Pluteus cervinus]